MRAVTIVAEPVHPMGRQAAQQLLQRLNSGAAGLTAAPQTPPTPPDLLRPPSAHVGCCLLTSLLWSVWMLGCNNVPAFM